MQFYSVIDCDIIVTSLMSHHHEWKNDKCSNKQIQIISKVMFANYECSKMKYKFWTSEDTTKKAKPMLCFNVPSLCESMRDNKSGPLPKYKSY